MVCNHFSDIGLVNCQYRKKFPCDVSIFILKMRREILKSCLSKRHAGLGSYGIEPKKKLSTINISPSKCCLVVRCLTYMAHIYWQTLGIVDCCVSSKHPISIPCVYGGLTRFEHKNLQNINPRTVLPVSNVCSMSGWGELVFIVISIQSQALHFSGYRLSILVSAQLYNMRHKLNIELICI